METMKVSCAFSLVAVLLASGGANAAPPAAGSQTLLTLHTVAVDTFNPTRGQKKEWIVSLSRPAAVTVTIFDLKGQVVQTVEPGFLGADYHRVEWDGRDRRAQVVPDGVYTYRIEALVSAGRQETLGGPGEIDVQLFGESDVAFDASKGSLSYFLSRPALVRFFIKQRPSEILRVLPVWEVREPGKNIEKWDGKDGSGRAELRELPDLFVEGSAILIPQHSLVVEGGTARSWPWGQVPGYRMEVEVLDPPGPPGGWNPVVVDDVVRFRFRAEPLAAGTRWLSFKTYLDGNLYVVENTWPTIPNEVRTTYRGVLEGEHVLTFVGIDEWANVASVSIPIHVRHRKAAKR